MRVTLLGCGGSTGTPLATGEWGDCDPAEPRNRRLRPSILIEEGRTRVIVDTGPDFREQLLSVGGGTLDAVVYTHAHADHIHGLDDIRCVNYLLRAAIPAYAEQDTLGRIRSRFPYAFRPYDGTLPSTRPHLTPRPVEPGETIRIGDIEIELFAQDHNVCQTLGLRVGPFAYSTDVVRLGPDAFETLKGIDVWIVDCLRRAPHPAHADLATVMGWIDRVKPRRAYFTHMNHEMDYRSLLRELPPGVEPGWDGLVLEF